MLRSEHHGVSQRYHGGDDGNRARDLSQSYFALMLNVVVRCTILSIFIFAATNIIFRTIHFAFESSNERIIKTCKPSRKPLDKIRSRRILLLTLLVGLLQPCNFCFGVDSISNCFVTSLRGRIVDTDTEMLTSVNEATNDVSFDLNTECLLDNEGDEYVNHLHSSSISSVETRDESKTRCVKYYYNECEMESVPVTAARDEISSSSRHKTSHLDILQRRVTGVLNHILPSSG